MSELNFELNLLSDSTLHKMRGDISYILASRHSDYGFMETDGTWMVLATQIDNEIEQRIVGEAQEEE